MRVTGEILKEFEFDLESLTLIPARGGVFEVALDGELIYSKKETGRHAEPDEIPRLLRDRLRG